jgi:energy-coupling factor transporter ATP-binding protein EcfA2
MEGNTKSLNDKNFSKHLSCTIFKYDKYNIKFTDLYKILEEGIFIDDNFLIDKYYDEEQKYYSLTYILDDDILFYFFDDLITVEIFDVKNNKKNNFFVCSTYEIDLLIENYPPSSLYLGKKEIVPHGIGPLLIKDNKIIFNYYEKKLESIKCNDNFIYKGVIEPSSFSHDFYTYFPEQIKQDKIIYIESKRRKNFLNFINNYLKYNKILKITGPSGIGKSFFLLLISRKAFNYLYLNLGALMFLYQKNKFIEMINIIINEINRIRLDKKNIEQLNEYFKNLKTIEFENIIKNLIEYFNTQKIKIKIILDQFKIKYFKSWESIEKSIDNKSSIYIIICSSINDKNIRESCCKLIDFFYEKGIIDEFETKEYFYISNLFDKNDVETFLNTEKVYDDNAKEILSYFDYNLKYVFKLISKNNIYSEIANIDKKVKNKLKNFYGDEKDIELSLKLASLKRFIGYKIPISNFQKIISNFSLKYFTITFYNENEKIDFFKNNEKILYFEIKYIFPYISEIIDDLTLDANDIFFDCSLYKDHTNSTIGGFLELTSINKIQKKFISLPNGGYDYILQVDKINEMKEIKPKFNDILNNKLALINIKEVQKRKDNEEDESINSKTMLFEYDALPQFQEKELISFQNDFLVQDLKINQIKTKFISENNVHFKLDNKLLFSTKLFVSSNDKSINIEIKNEDNKYHKLKDKNILITQLYQNAPAYDLAYLYGNSENKIFVGFQMKSYRDYEKKNRSFSLSKEEVINQSKLLLFNSKYFFNVDIVELHFIIVGLYFKDDSNLPKEITYSNDLIKFCKKNNLKLILYEPFEKAFYDDNKEKINEIIIPDTNTNLLKEEFFQPYDDSCNNSNFFLQKKTKRQLVNELAQFAKKNLNIIDEKKIRLTEIKKQIEDIVKILELKNLRYVNSNKIKHYNPLPAPNNEVLFLFTKKRKAEEKDNKNFCGIYKKDDKFYGYDFEFGTFQELDYICDYYYYINKKERYYIFKMEFKE